MLRNKCLYDAHYVPDVHVLLSKIARSYEEHLAFRMGKNSMNSFGAFVRSSSDAGANSQVDLFCGS